MDDFTEKITSIVNNVDGSYEGAFCGMDGIIISKFCKTKTNLDIDFVCAHFVTVIKSMNQIEKLKETSLYFLNHLIYVKILDGGFILLIISPNGNLGHAKISCSKIPNNFVG